MSSGYSPVRSARGPWVYAPVRRSPLRDDPVAENYDDDEDDDDQDHDEDEDEDLAVEAQPGTAGVGTP